MIVVSIDLWPNGDPEEWVNLGQLEIVNDLSNLDRATPDDPIRSGTGNYRYKLIEREGQVHATHTGTVKNYPRYRGAAELVRRAIGEAKGIVG